jgi:glycosyltransferase involved in cell wall biosynthesis
MFREKGFFVTTWQSVPPLRFLKQRQFNKNYRFTKIGWVGSTNIHNYITNIIPILDQLSKQHKFIFSIVTSKKNFNLLSSEIKNRQYIQFHEWHLENEWNYFDDIDIIIMPLDASKFSQAKCGFKLLQGMFRGAVPIGYYTEANAKLVYNGDNGFLFKTNDELYHQLSTLLNKNVNLKNYCKKSYDIIMQQGLFLENYVQKLINLLASL